MKTGFKRLLTLLLACAMLFALSATAFAEGDEEEVPGDEPSEYEQPEDAQGEQPDPIEIEMLLDELELEVGDSTRVAAFVDGEGEGAKYEWRTGDRKVVTVSGSGSDATVKAAGSGHTEITLTVISRDGRSEFAFIDVSVKEAVAPVSVSGGSSVTLEESGSERIQAGVSGGSGSYDFSWEWEGAVEVENCDESSAEVYAVGPGTGTVILTVYDSDDYSNNGTTTWKITVKESEKKQEPPSLEMNRGSVDIGAGGSAQLRVMASGGSGDYEYIWRSDNPRIVSVYGDGDTGEIRASDMLVRDSDSAEISAVVRDRKSGLMSNTEVCVVHVSGGSTQYNAFDTVYAGESLSFENITKEIASVYRISFNEELSLSASVMFTNPASRTGSVRYQDGTAISSGTSYTFAVFQMLGFRADAPGTHSTAYRINDGGNTVEGTITIEVTGGVPVRNASISRTSVDMYTYSNEYLTLSVTPSNASYDVVWESSNTGIVTVDGKGNKVTLKSHGKEGSATVSALVYDANGNLTKCTCKVRVEEEEVYDPTVYFDMSLTIMLGADYYGSKLADSMTNKFRSAFGVYPSEKDTIQFPTLGSSRYGTMLTRGGSPVKTNTKYTFRDWVDMYFVPTAAGTYAMSYQLQRGNDVMRGNINVIVQSASVTVSMNAAALQMAPYSSRYISLDIIPGTGYSYVGWSSSDTRVAKVTGSNATALIESVGNGTATITAVVVDRRGVELRRTCTVLVTSNGSVFNPSVSTTLGIPYVGTGTSSAMRSQFASVYGFALQDSATIRFASSGNTEVGVMRLADGSMIRPNVDYTFAQYVAMYTQPVTAGTYSVPYTLTYAGKQLSGTVSVVISPARVITDIWLPVKAAYGFSDIVGSTTGSVILASSINNTVGSGWSYIRFGSASCSTGVLYLNRTYVGINPDTAINQAGLSQLYFVPTDINGAFYAPYTVYSGTGSVLATGTLRITRPGPVFADIPAGIYYKQAVDWAVSMGITSGTSYNMFSPNMIVTHAQAVTFLWNTAGQPMAVSPVNPFADAVAGSYYYDAMLWGVQQGIIDGSTVNIFAPETPISRIEFLTMLCRAYGGFAGGPDWERLALNWANTRGLLAGVSADYDLHAACSRSEAVYYLWRVVNS